MKIVLFHPVRLPPADYGGVERVVLWLASGLRDLGHSVWVAALEGSKLPPGIQLIPIAPNEKSAEGLLARLPPGVDVVHFQAPPETAFLEKAAVASLTTIHGNGKPGEIFSGNTVFLSRDHASRHQRKSFVYNGVDPTEFHLSTRKKRNAPLFLSKTSWKVKNLRGAIRIANHAGLGLTIAGGYRPIDLLVRTLFSPHQWVGPVNGEFKAQLLSEASALLFPVLWNEPFGLVMVEALLSGTPVVASRLGSVPEILSDFGGAVLEPIPSVRLRNSHKGLEIALDSWAQALRDVEKLDPVHLRETAIKRFSNLRMAEAYLEVYKRVQNGENLQ